MGFTANEVWGTTPPGVQIPPSPRLAPVQDRGLLRFRELREPSPVRLFAGGRADQGGSMPHIRPDPPATAMEPATARPGAGGSQSRSPDGRIGACRATTRLTRSS